MFNLPLGRPGWRPPRDYGEQGIALQTLVITAVMLLLAVSAGVLVQAIARRAADDLAGQATSFEASPCNAVEVYDIAFAAQGVSGSHQGHAGSEIGCRPVCALTFVVKEGKFFVRVVARPEQPVDKLASIRQYSYDDRYFTAYKLKARYPEISEYGDGEGVQIEGDVRLAELLGKTVLLQDSKSFFADGAAEGLEFHETVRIASVHGEEGVRATQAGRVCETYALPG